MWYAWKYSYAVCHTGSVLFGMALAGAHLYKLTSLVNGPAIVVSKSPF